MSRRIHGYKTKNNPSKVYTAWLSMRSRCKTRKIYIARGIIVCQEWENSFLNFIRDVGLPPTPDHTLERVDNEKGYSKENCIWALPETQNNNKSVSVKINYLGRTQTIGQWAKELNIPYMTLWNRWNKHRRIL